MFKSKRKNDEFDAKFQPGACLAAYLLAQLYFVFVALGAFFFLLFSGAVLMQPLLLVWLLILLLVGMGTLLSIMRMWDGERAGYYGLIISYTLFFMYFLNFTMQYKQAGIPYLILLLINMALLLIMIHPKRHLVS